MHWIPFKTYSLSAVVTKPLVLAGSHNEIHFGDGNVKSISLSMQNAVTLSLENATALTLFASLLD